MEKMENQLHYGDCLKVMQEEVPAESVDLVYADPPFNSNRDYNQIYNNTGKVVEGENDFLGIDIKTMKRKPIHSALLSVYNKDGIAEVAQKLSSMGAAIYSTGGTLRYLQQCGIEAVAVESLTGYPSILGGRVKTLHPAVFGGILARRNRKGHMNQLQKYRIPAVDAVVTDLYPFEETMKLGASEQEIIEKIDIGGISLIRAAAKNYADVVVIPSREYYGEFLQILSNGGTNLQERRALAAHAFNISSHYDSMIFHYFHGNEDISTIKHNFSSGTALRYGENPHQRAMFFGDITQIVEQLHGREVSYNNLLDIEAAVRLAADFSGTMFGIIKHNNPCGVAERTTTADAYSAALQCDPVSAFGGVLITNGKVDEAAAQRINELFFEVLLAPAYDGAALKLLCQKKNRILMKVKSFALPKILCRTLLNGIAQQDADTAVESAQNMAIVTTAFPTEAQLEDLVFAGKVVKHCKSNAIVLAKNKQLLASGVGQTARVDALRQAVEKAGRFGFSLRGAVMASDAFFPFADCVEIAHQCGIAAIVQPGGSIRDTDSITYCNANGIAMAMTGKRHFWH